jgi:hypothetical protein
MKQRPFGAVIVACWAVLSLGTRWTSPDATLFPVFLGPRLSDPPGVRLLDPDLLRTFNRPRLGDFSLMSALTVTMGILAVLCIVRFRRSVAGGAVVLAAVHVISTLVVLGDVYGEYRGQPDEWVPLFSKIILGSAALAIGAVLLARQWRSRQPDTSTT